MKSTCDSLAPPPSEEALENARVRVRSRCFIAGKCYGGLAEAHRLKQLGSRGLPKCPDAGVIPPVKIPAPPLISASDSELSRAQILGVAYRGAAQVFYRRRSDFLLSGDLQKHRSYKALVFFAELLHTGQTAPAAWIMFSMDVWRFMGGKKPPKVSWVFSTKRLETQREWFLGETNRWTGGHWNFAPKHLALYARWQRMWRELMCKKPDTVRSLMVTVDEHFPGYEYEHAVEAARGEARRMQSAVDRRIAAGEIVWTA